MQLIFKDAASPIQSTSCKEIILRNDAGNGKTEIEKGAPMLFGALSLYTFIHHSFTQESRAWCMLSMSLTPARPPHPPIDCMRRVHDLSVLLLPRCSRSHDQNNAVFAISRSPLSPVRQGKSSVCRLAQKWCIFQLSLEIIGPDVFLDPPASPSVHLFV